MQRDKESFDDVIWTDESSVMLDLTARKSIERTPKAQTKGQAPSKSACMGWYITKGGHSRGVVHWHYDIHEVCTDS